MELDTRKEKILFDWLIKSLMSSSDWTQEELENYVEIKLSQAVNNEK